MKNHATTLKLCHTTLKSGAGGYLTIIYHTPVFPAFAPDHALKPGGLTLPLRLSLPVYVLLPLYVHSLPLRAYRAL